MSRVAIRVPEENDLLCEKCGYVLNGLPADGRCPECGAPVDESLGQRRFPPAFEAHPTRASAFIATTAMLLFKTRRFFKTSTTRGPLMPAARFALLHWVLASVLFAIAAYLHADWYHERVLSYYNQRLSLWIFVALFVGTLGFMWSITHLAARLTVIEARFRGYRLPLPVVLRGMYWHSAHFLPVAIVSAATVSIYTLGGRGFWAASAPAYLYTLCGEVILGAAYLFETYWVAMRNMMYANR